MKQVSNMNRHSTRRFLQLTYEMLQTETHSHLVRWSEDGNQIVIVDKAQFALIVLPSYFKHNNFTSFLRQLNSYEFKSGKDQAGTQVYYHPQFRKGQFNQELIKYKCRPTTDSSSDLLHDQHEDQKKQLQNLLIEQQKLQMQVAQQVNYFNELRRTYNSGLKNMLRQKILGKTKTYKALKCIRKFIQSLATTGDIGFGSESCFPGSILVAVCTLLQDYGVITADFDTLSNQFQVDQSLDIFTMCMNNKFKAFNEY